MSKSEPGHARPAGPVSGRERVAVESDFADVEAGWEALADRLQASPFLRPGWFSAWWDAFSEGALEIVAVYRGDRLAAVTPFRRRRGSLRTLTNYHTPQFGLLAEDVSAAKTLVDAAVRRGFRRTTFVYVDSSDRALVEEASHAAGRRTGGWAEPVESSPYVTVSGTFDEFLEGLDGKLRRDLRRRRRRLEEHGAVTFEMRDGSEELQVLLDEGYALEASGWKADQGTAIVSSTATLDFYNAIARWAAARGVLRLAFLRVDGRALAFQLAMEESGVYYCIKTGFDFDERRFAPQKLLVQEVLRRAFDRGMSTFEFLGIDDEWKLEWTDSVRERYFVHCFAPFAGLAEWAAVRYGPSRIASGLAFR